MYSPLACPCPANLICIEEENICDDPCLQSWTCGSDADCEVIDHEIICSCSPDYLGYPDPYVVIFLFT